MVLIIKLLGLFAIPLSSENKKNFQRAKNYLHEYYTYFYYINV